MRGYLIDPTNPNEYTLYDTDTAKHIKQFVTTSAPPKLWSYNTHPFAAVSNCSLVSHPLCPPCPLTPTITKWSVCWLKIEIKQAEFTSESYLHLWLSVCIAWLSAKSAKQILPPSFDHTLVRLHHSKIPTQPPLSWSSSYPVKLPVQ